MITKKRLEIIQKASVPTWFKANVMTSSKGGKNNYSETGYHVAIHLDKLVDSDEAIDEFNSGKNIKEWCAKWIPHIMKFIPYKSRDMFFKGMEEGFENACPF